jgi:hypothetical protein
MFLEKYQFFLNIKKPIESNYKLLNFISLTILEIK